MSHGDDVSGFNQTKESSCEMSDMSHGDDKVVFFTSLKGCVLHHLAYRLGRLLKHSGKTNKHCKSNEFTYLFFYIKLQKIYWNVLCDLS